MADIKPNTGGGGGGFGGGPRGGMRGGPGGARGGMGGNRGGGMGGRGPRRTRPPGDAPQEFTADGQKVAELVEKVVFINRNSKVVKGGRRFSFSALVVVGDKQGRVGLGLGKSNEVSDAIRKGGEMAKVSMVPVALKGNTLPHEVTNRHCGAIVLLRPASPGTGIIAGKTVRAVLESAGYKDVLTKSLGSNNPANVVKATLGALQQLRLRADVYKARGLSLRVEKAPEAPGTAAVVTA